MYYSTVSVFLKYFFSSIQNFSIGGDGNHLPRNKLSAGLQSTLDCVFDTAAAGYFHPYHLYTLDVVVPDDLRQLFRIIPFVQLGTADQGDMVPDKIVMEAAVSISCTVCRNQQICAVKIGSIYRYQFDLAGPLLQLTGYSRRFTDGSGYIPSDGFGLGSGTAAGEFSFCNLIGMAEREVAWNKRGNHQRKDQKDGGEGRGLSLFSSLD